MEMVAKGWSALQEVDRVIDYADLNDTRLIPFLRGAEENFELALEVDKMNTHTRYWLSRMHFKYHVPGACKAVGAALLIEAANMGDADAQYELGCKLRVDNGYVQTDQKAFYYLEKAVYQLHPGALYLLGAVYLTGDCVKKDVASAMWCFHRASEKGHAGAAIACWSLLLKGIETNIFFLVYLIQIFYRFQVIPSIYCACRTFISFVVQLTFCFLEFFLENNVNCWNYYNIKYISSNYDKIAPLTVCP